MTSKTQNAKHTIVLSPSCHPSSPSSYKQTSHLATCTPKQPTRVFNFYAECFHLNAKIDNRMLHRGILQSMIRKASGHERRRAYRYVATLSVEVTAASIVACGLVVASINEQNKNLVTRMEYWDHNPEDFDYYVTRSEMTKDHLPILLRKFDHEHLDVWPWIWTHPNNDGPHHVYIGINYDVLDEIMKLCNGEHSEQNNILIDASEEALRKVAMEHIHIHKQRYKKREDDNDHDDDDDSDSDDHDDDDHDCMSIYSRYQCGLVTDSQLELLNEDAKILMLDDERVVAYDFLTVL